MFSIWLNTYLFSYFYILLTELHVIVEKVRGEEGAIIKGRPINDKIPPDSFIPQFSGWNVKSKSFTISSILSCMYQTIGQLIQWHVIVYI